MAVLRGLPQAVPGRPRGLGWLALAVLVLHLLLAEGLLPEPQGGWGRGDRPPPAIDVAFVRELQAAAPVARPAPAAPPPARLPALARQARPAASQPAAADEDAEAAAKAQSREAAAANAADAKAAAAETAPPPSVPDPAPAAVAALADAAPEASAAARPLPIDAQPTALPAASAAAAMPGLAASPAAAQLTAAAASASAAPATAASDAFAWPPSTRMNYLLTGHYRGPVNGTAQVDWLREGSRYQVRMRTAIGPVLSRQIASEGELTAQGLAPRRFDGEQKVLFTAARRWGLRFTPERITLADGREIDSLPGAQDEASQFVQLTWLFSTQPGLLQVGRSIVVPLIVNRTLERWTYDVVAEELLQFPFGSVPTFHVKPRREAKGSDMLAEIWFAPSLQYLPVRILIRQREESFADLTLERPPLQAAPAQGGLP